MQNNHTIMTARTTLSLDKSDLEKLEKIVKKEQYRSLSAMMKEIIAHFLAAHEKKQEYEQMAKAYQQYQKKTSHKAFAEIEEAALSDLIHRP